jgi:hypothetical protein
MQKKIESETVSVIKFTEEEADQLNLEVGKMFSAEVNENGSLTLTPYAEIEIDFEQFDRSLLLYLIEKSLNEDISMNKVIENILLEACDYWEKNEC